MTDDVIPRYLVLVDGKVCSTVDGGESEAIHKAETMPYQLARSIEVVRSVRRWELDTATGEMLEVGEKLTQLT